MPPELFVLLLTVLACGHCGLIHSSFWAPLFDRRILNYRVDVPFDARAGVAARQRFANEYGYRGEKLIVDLGNGKGPGPNDVDRKGYGDVTVYYT